MMKKVFIWDIAIRLFHWLLVICFIGAFATIKTNHVEWHALFGCIIAGLLFFRIMWGFFGSQTARFRYFFKPHKIIAYLQNKEKPLGHNPLGALMVLGFIFILSLQIILGLFSNDDILFDAPFAHLIERSLSDKITWIHINLSKLIIFMVVIHVGAVLYYWLKKKQNLVITMIRGWQYQEKAPEKPLFFASSWRYIIIISLAILFSLLLISYLP